MSTENYHSPDAPNGCWCGQKHDRCSCRLTGVHFGRHTCKACGCVNKPWTPAPKKQVVFYCGRYVRGNRGKLEAPGEYRTDSLTEVWEWLTKQILSPRDSYYIDLREE